MRLYLPIGVAVLSLSPIVTATLLTDDFSQGLRADRWQTMQVTATGAPWMMNAPDAGGKLDISKPADSDSATGKTDVYSGIKSRFTLEGDLSVFIDFGLLKFSGATNGWNQAILKLVATDSGAQILSIRYTNGLTGQYAQGLSNLSGPLTSVPVATVSGKLGITRSGQTVSTWIDRGSGPISLGSTASPQFAGPMEVRILAVQGTNSNGRPHNAIDVRFDNFTAIAETIVPEPTGCFLIGLGGLAMLLSRRPNPR